MEPVGPGSRRDGREPRGDANKPKARPRILSAIPLALVACVTAPQVMGLITMGLSIYSIVSVVTAYNNLRARANDINNLVGPLLHPLSALARVLVPHQPRHRDPDAPRSSSFRSELGDPPDRGRRRGGLRGRLPLGLLRDEPAELAGACPTTTDARRRGRRPPWGATSEPTVYRNQQIILATVVLGSNAIARVVCLPVIAQGTFEGPCSCPSGATQGDESEISSQGGCDNNQTDAGCKSYPAFNSIPLTRWRSGMTVCALRGGEASLSMDGGYKERPYVRVPAAKSSFQSFSSSSSLQSLTLLFVSHLLRSFSLLFSVSSCLVLPCAPFSRSRSRTARARWATSRAAQAPTTRTRTSVSRLTRPAP